MMFEPVPADTEFVATEIIGAAIEVHRALGPGFLEKIYQEALCLELDARGLPFERERAVAVHYRGQAIPGQRIDLIVSRCVLVELKASTRIDVIHEAKVISYLRTTGLRLGLLLNFNAGPRRARSAQRDCGNLLGLGRNGTTDWPQFRRRVSWAVAVRLDDAFWWRRGLSAEVQ